MPSGGTITYDSYKKIQKKTLNGRIVVQPHTWYTCPPGKKAIVKGEATCTGIGAGATSNLNMAGEIIRQANNTTQRLQPWDNPVRTNIVFPFEIELDAGDIIETTQSEGTNAEWNITATIEETEA